MTVFSVQNAPLLLVQICKLKQMKKYRRISVRLPKIAGFNVLNLLPLLTLLAKVKQLRRKELQRTAATFPKIAAPSHAWNSPLLLTQFQLSIHSQITCQLQKLLPVREIFCCLCLSWPHLDRSQKLLSSLLAKGLFLIAFEGVYICSMQIHLHSSVLTVSSSKPAMLLSMYTLAPLDLILTRVVLPTPICIKVCLAHVIVQLFV